jgi:hypothetical protein
VRPECQAWRLVYALRVAFVFYANYGRNV